MGTSTCWIWGNAKARKAKAMGYVELSTVKVKAARKARRCEWCSEQVEVGSPCVRRTYIFEGDFHSEGMHPECFEAMECSPEELEEGWTAGDFRRGSPISKETEREESRWQELQAAKVAGA